MHPRFAALVVALAGLVLTLGTFIGSGYSASAAAQDEKRAAKATFEVYKDAGGEFRWRMRAQNTQVIATSGDGYKEKRACLDAIDSVKRNAADAPIKEMD